MYQNAGLHSVQTAANTGNATQMSMTNLSVQPNSGAPPLVSAPAPATPDEKNVQSGTPESGGPGNGDGGEKEGENVEMMHTGKDKVAIPEFISCAATQEQEPAPYVNLSNMQSLEECIKLASHSLRTGMLHALNTNGGGVGTNDSQAALGFNEGEFPVTLPRQRTERDWLKEDLERRKELAAKKGDFYSDLLSKKKKVVPPEAPKPSSADVVEVPDDDDDEVVVVSDSREKRAAQAQRRPTTGMRSLPGVAKRRVPPLQPSIRKQPSLGNALAFRRRRHVPKADRAGSSALRKMKEGSKASSSLPSATRLRHARMMRRFNKPEKSTTDTIARNIAMIQRRNDLNAGKDDDNLASIDIIRLKRRQTGSSASRNGGSLQNSAASPQSQQRNAVKSTKAGSFVLPSIPRRGEKNTRQAAPILRSIPNKDAKRLDVNENSTGKTEAQGLKYTYKMVGNQVRPWIQDSSPQPKIPLKARQYFADKLYDLWIQAGIYEADAGYRTMAAEAKIYSTSPSKIEYRSGCASAVREAKDAVKAKAISDSQATAAHRNRIKTIGDQRFRNGRSK